MDYKAVVEVADMDFVVGMDFAVDRDSVAGKDSVADRDFVAGKDQVAGKDSVGAVDKGYCSACMDQIDSCRDYAAVEDRDYMQAVAVGEAVAVCSSSS